MPAALNVDWTAIATQAAAGASLQDLSEHWGIPINTLKTRSAREGWKSTAREISKARLGQGTCEVIKGSGGLKQSETLGDKRLNLFAKLGSKSQLSLAKGVQKTSKGLERKDPEWLTNNTSALKNTVDAASKLFGWDKADNQAPLVNLNILQVPPPSA